MRRIGVELRTDSLRLTVRILTDLEKSDLQRGVEAQLNHQAESAVAPWIVQLRGAPGRLAE